MQFSAQREILLKPLQQVVNVVERRQTLPVLSNLLILVGDSVVSFTASDMEVEMIGSMQVDAAVNGSATIPARKFFDIVRALPDGCSIDVRGKADKIVVSAGKSRFTLSTLPAGDFPLLENPDSSDGLVVSEQALATAINRTAFAMAHQDVRYFLNGLLLELGSERIRCVATDGHRLALSDATVALGEMNGDRQVIIPRKGVLELQRLLEGGDGTVSLELGRHFLRVRRGQFVLSTKLIDGRFPEYQSVIPIGADKDVIVERDVFKTALQRAAILSNEKYRGVKLEVSSGRLRISSNNPEQEEAVEEISVETTVENIAVGFNVTYLMDALNALDGERVRLSLRDGNSSCLLRRTDGDDCQHVIMPLRL